MDGARTLSFLVKLFVPAAPEEVMDTGELALTTADTRPLSAEAGAHLQQDSNENRPIETVVEKEKMGTLLPGSAELESSEGFGDTLLDLGDFDASPMLTSDEIILDIDFDSSTPEVL